MSRFPAFLFFQLKESFLLELTVFIFSKFHKLHTLTFDSLVYCKILYSLIYGGLRLFNCGGYAATCLYNPLGGAYYRSYGFILLSRGIKRQRPSGDQLLATRVYTRRIDRLACITAYYVLVTRLSACTVQCTAIIGRL